MQRKKKADPIDMMAWEIVGLLGVTVDPATWLRLRKFLAERMKDKVE